MKSQHTFYSIVATSALVCFLVLFGCSRATEEQRDSSDRYLRRAASAKAKENIETSIRWCEKALRRRPNSPAAHRELALMLDHYQHDSIAALYHYRRFLECNPDTEERAEVEEMMEICIRKIASQNKSHSSKPPRPPAQTSTTTSTTAKPSSTRSPPETTKPPEPPKPTPNATLPQTHLVKAGETLATISTLYYGTPSKWKHIHNANLERMPDANRLRPGTQIQIPPL